jgi:hypothetical protein
MGELSVLAIEARLGVTRSEPLSLGMCFGRRSGFYGSPMKRDCVAGVELHQGRQLLRRAKPDASPYI